jgi:pyruvate kinase
VFPFQARCSPPEVLDQLALNRHVSLDDGVVTTVVEALLPAGAVLRVERVKEGEYKLKNEKGLNFPDTDLRMAALTPDDLLALDSVVELADMVGYSFVQTGRDIALLQSELTKRMDDPTRMTIIAKIETPRAVRNLPEIIVRAAGRQPFGVMIARGDLAVELGFVRTAEMQEEILWLCEAAHVPVIWATQVLESYVKDGMPSRGEMTDAAMAARAECVMLNKGPYIVDAVAMVDDLLRRMREHQTKKSPQMRALRSWMPHLGDE